MRLLIFSFAILGTCAVNLAAQASSNGQESSYQVSTSQPWTDTGLDLQSGEVLEISAGPSQSSVPDRHIVSGIPACDPNGVSASADQAGNLPVPAAKPGALIGRLHAQGAAPMLLGASTQVRIEEPSHLLLGMNIEGTAPCQGELAVKVRRLSADSVASTTTPKPPVSQNLTSNSAAPTAQSTQPASSAPGASAGQTKTRGEQLKSQLSTAAQIFMSGQFGTGKSDSASSTSSAVSTGSGSSADSASPAPALSISKIDLDPDLRKSLDSLPRRVNDQFQNLGDMVNFVIIGPQKDVQAALDAATWHVADTDNQKAVLGALLQTYEKKDYLQMPMSTLFLFGRKQDFGYEMAEPIAMVASRHHFRIWKAPFTYKGQEVWVGAGTHDIGFAKDQRNGSVTHKIDPAVDGERDNIAASLQKANKSKSISYYLPSNPVQEAKNATGDGYHSDGRLVIVFLQ